VGELMREVAVRAPGRVNLIGDHTDYNDGFVLPLAVDRECRVVGTATDEGLALRFAQGGDDNSLRIAHAVGEALRARGIALPGLDADVSSTVPIGSGLSSSSALAVGLATAFCVAAGRELAPEQVARACQEAETAATGVPGGIMDQLAAVRGRGGHALLIDCRSLSVTPVPLPPDVAVVVVDSGVPRRLAGSAYAERRAHCEAVAARLGLAALRDATLAQVRDDPHARHVVTENARVLAASSALHAGDVATVGQLMVESHVSLRDDYGVSIPELDRIVDALLAAGAFGARLTGAGFGGCVVALAARADAGRIATEVGGKRGFVVRAADGAGALGNVSRSG
jgi:galactokinase